MNATNPFQVIIIRHREDTEGLPFQEAVERAFKGGTSVGGYLASGEDLGVEIRKFDAVPQLQDSLAALLDTVQHTLVVGIIDYEALNDAKLLDWIEACWALIRSSQGRHQLLLLTLDERVGDKLRFARPTLETNQSITPQQLGERAIRPALFSLRVLHDARVLLASALRSGRTDSPTPGFLRLFISHAKLDGLPLAQALKHQIESIPWLSSFYDARELANETDWQRALEQAVASSLLVILRTDAYEHRWWCRQEALWSEEYATPTVLVEARPGLSYPAGELPLERMPSIRIPDGNLLRILHAALREGLRYLLFQRRVAQMQADGVIPKNGELRVFSYPPSMAALLRACREMATVPRSTTSDMILYPDPPLRTGVYEAAHALVAAHAPGVRLLTPETLAAKPVP